MGKSHLLVLLTDDNPDQKRPWHIPRLNYNQPLKQVDSLRGITNHQE